MNITYSVETDINKSFVIHWYEVKLHDKIMAMNTGNESATDLEKEIN